MSRPTGPGPWCGTINGYVNHGCRCTDCRKANAAASRRYAKANPEQAAKHVARRRAVRAGLIEPTMHPSERVAACGTEAGFERHARRGEEPCDDCKAARVAAQRVRRAAARGRSRSTRSAVHFLIEGSHVAAIDGHIDRGEEHLRRPIARDREGPGRAAGDRRESTTVATDGESSRRF